MKLFESKFYHIYAEKAQTYRKHPNSVNAGAYMQMMELLLNDLALSEMKEEKKEGTK